MVAAGLFAIFVAHETYTKADTEIMQPLKFHEPRFDLLDTVTRYDMTPHAAIMFLKENDLKVNLVVEWTQGGPVMFYAPNAKLYMDGRAQQVYDEKHYMKYAALLVQPDAPRNYIMRLLDESDTNAVLLRRTARVENLWSTLEQSGQWVLALVSLQNGLFLRKGSQPLERLGELLRRNQEWRPSYPGAVASRGFVWQAVTPPDPEQAIACWNDGLRQNVLIGFLVFRPMTETLLELRGKEAAERFVTEWFDRLNQPVPGLADETRRNLLNELRGCWDLVKAAESRQAADEAATKPSAP